MLNIRNSSTIYVDQKNGNNKLYNGLKATVDKFQNGPFQSLEHALEIVKNLRVNGDQRPLSIALTDDYFTEKLINIPPEVTDLTIESKGKSKRIIGGFALKDWKEDFFNGVKCLSAKLSEERKNIKFSDLYVNNKRAKVTRFPKTGTLKAERTQDDLSVKTSPLFTPCNWFIAKKDDLKGLAGIEDAYVNYYHYWIDEHSPIESYDGDTNKITMKYSSRFLITSNYQNREPSDIFYYLSNVPSTFGEEGEWYYDREKGKIYYIPLPDESPEKIEVFVPLTDKLFNISSHDIRIRDLELCVTDCDYESHSRSLDDPETGLCVYEDAAYGADKQSVCYAYGAINIKDSSRITISNCHIHSLGIHAIAVESGCDHIRIENNLIEDIAAGGIKIFGGKYGSEEKYHTNDCIITANEIRDIGKRYEAGCGVLICHAHDNLIENNHIHHGGYSGISVGWEWGYSDNESYANIIRGNHIHDLGQGTLSDMGGIYTLGRQHGTVISENRIHDVKCENYGAWGIYLDEGTSHVTVENNIVYDTGTECFHLHYGAHNIVRNNIFASTGSASAVRLSKNELLPGVVFERNVLTTCGAPIYNVKRALGNFNSSSNLIWDFSREKALLYKNDDTEFDLEAWQREYNQDPNSILADPMFESLENKDLSLSEDSFAFKMGFKKISEKVTKPKE